MASCPVCANMSVCSFLYHCIFICLFNSKWLYVYSQISDKKAEQDGVGASGALLETATVRDHSTVTLWEAKFT